MKALIDVIIGIIMIWGVVMIINVVHVSDYTELLAGLTLFLTPIIAQFVIGYINA